MAKHTRVYQAAKEHRISSEVLMGILPQLGIEVKGHLDKLSEEEFERVAEWFEKYPDGTPPPEEAKSALEDAATAETPAPDASTPEPDAAPAKPDVTAPRQPVMPPPEVTTSQVFMPPVETTPPPPPPPTPVAPMAEKPAGTPSVEETPKTEELRQTPQRPDATPERPAREKKPQTAEKAEKPKRARREERPERTVERRREDVTRDPEVEEATGRRIVHGRATADLIDTQSGGDAGRRRRTKRKKKPAASQEEIQKNVQKTLTEMGRGRVRRTYDRRSPREEEEVQEETNVLRVTEFISVSELADLMDVKPAEVIAACLKLGLMVSLNQRLDWDTILIIADEYDFVVEQMEDKEIDEIPEIEDLPEDLKPRPPVVTVMGHVDHGKTSLLDYIRNANVIGGESGGITQHIGAYEVETANGRVTFLDTPGHEAFTAMRARGAQITDVVVLVIAADDAVMPQTIEAINHARAANVSLFIAINKVDLPAANPDKIKQQLTEQNIIIEEYGGKTQAVEISAKTGQGVNELLELLALETELLDLKANPDRDARGTVVEARLDKGRGPVATVLVEAGTLRVGDPFLAGMHAGRVRAMLDERGNRVEAAGPSKPVQVLGFDDVPTAGDTFVVYEDEREARSIAQYRQQLKREQDYSRTKKISLRTISERISEGGLKTLPVIVKGDVDGSVEALSDELGKLSNPEVAVEVIHRGVGAITEGDVLLASASHALIVGFHVRPDSRARELAEQEQVEIHLYQVIYEAIEELKASLSGLLDAKITEKIAGEAEVRQLFKVPRVGTVAGCMVRSGTIRRTDKIRVIRDGQVVYDGNIGTLRRIKDDVREVASGYECGIWVENFNDVKVGDILETYTLIEEARTFEEVAAT